MMKEPLKSPTRKHIRKILKLKDPYALDTAKKKPKKHHHCHSKKAYSS